MQKPLVSFIFWLLAGLLITFSIHLGILSALNKPLLAHHIILTYGLNFIMAFGIYLIIFLLKKRYNDSLGFIFMGGSLFKFGLYFFIIHPLYKADGIIEKPETLTFFIPYGICLIIETRALIRLLNS